MERKPDDSEAEKVVAKENRIREEVPRGVRGLDKTSNGNEEEVELNSRSEREEQQARDLTCLSSEDSNINYREE